MTGPDKLTLCRRHFPLDRQESPEHLWAAVHEFLRVLTADRFVSLYETRSEISGPCLPGGRPGITVVYWGLRGRSDATTANAGTVDAGAANAEASPPPCW